MSLIPGEVVLDLALVGLTAFSIPAGGEKGSVIGVVMTPEMVSRARNNATKGNFVNTDFRLGEIEHLPVADHTVDSIILGDMFVIHMCGIRDLHRLEDNRIIWRIMLEATKLYYRRL